MKTFKIGRLEVFYNNYVPTLIIRKQKRFVKCPLYYLKILFHLDF